MNNNRFPSKEAVNALRARFPIGTRVELVRMNDPHTTLKPGDQGTVQSIDDIGTVFVDWDNGSGLGVVYGEDVIKRITKVSAKVVEEIMALRKLPDCPNMFDTRAVQRLAFEHDFYHLVTFIESDAKAYARFILTGDEG